MCVTPLIREGRAGSRRKAFAKKNLFIGNSQACAGAEHVSWHALPLRKLPALCNGAGKVCIVVVHFVVHCFMNEGHFSELPNGLIYGELTK